MTQIIRTIRCNVLKVPKFQLDIEYIIKPYSTNQYTDIVAFKSISPRRGHFKSRYITTAKRFKPLPKAKMLAGLEMAIASESSLGKDWLRPEEDEAWADL